MEQQIHLSNHRGERLAATLHLPDGPPGRGVILGHCFTCSRHTAILRQICHGLAEAGFAVLRFDFSGNGQSEGAFAESTHSKQIAEVKDAAGFISEKGVAWIGLAGHSLGAVVALLAAAEMSSVKAVCTLAARSSGLDMVQLLDENQKKELQRTGRVHFVSRRRPLEITREFFADAARYDLPAVVASLRQPLLVVHGDQDEIIPVGEAYRLHGFRLEGTELAVIPGADHMFSQDQHRRQVADLAIKWFRQQASEGTA